MYSASRLGKLLVICALVFIQLYGSSIDDNIIYQSENFLLGFVTINVRTNLISPLNGHQWNKFHKTLSYLTKTLPKPTRFGKRYMQATKGFDHVEIGLCVTESVRTCV